MNRTVSFPLFLQKCELHLWPSVMNQGGLRGRGPCGKVESPSVCVWAAVPGYTSDPSASDLLLRTFLQQTAETVISGVRLESGFHAERLSVVCLLINGVNDRRVLHQHYSCAFWPCCVCFGSAAIRAIVSRLNIVLPPGSAVVFGRSLDVPPLPITHRY